MNPRMKILCLALVGAGATTLASFSALAQQAQRAERIEVTGSNIKRVEGETALPVAGDTRRASAHAIVTG